MKIGKETCSNHFFLLFVLMVPVYLKCSVSITDFFENIEYLSFISDSKAGILSRLGTFVSLDFRLVKMFRKSVFSPGNVGVSTSRFILREVC